MEFAKNEWHPLYVEDVYLGDCFHHFESTTGEKSTYIGRNVRLVQENVTTTEEYYVIGLRSEHIGVFVPQLVIDKTPFEKLSRSPFTRVVDYFVMARNCTMVFGKGESAAKYMEKYDSDSHDDFGSFNNDEDVKIYSFRDSEHNIKFDFVIDFTLQ